MRHTSRPERTRSLPTRLELRYENLSTLSLPDFPWIGRLEEKIDGLSQVGESIFDGPTLACNVELRTERHIRVVFPLNNGREEPIVCVSHSEPSLTWVPMTGKTADHPHKLGLIAATAGLVHLGSSSIRMVTLVLPPFFTATQAPIPY